jgi:hypothetical protein
VELEVLGCRCLLIELELDGRRSLLYALFKMVEDGRFDIGGRFVGKKLPASSTAVGDPLSVNSLPKLASETVTVMYPGLAGTEVCLDDGR